ncbi:MAG: 2-C-methyl-D-erythritol 4-phosphate cytidylyltransferase [Thermoguttaceae bacterium]|nr:2-C-methyl-D-erythritol 4-phosphate cytidylyltransferase [Thermoguttaceae bacterium]
MGKFCVILPAAGKSSRFGDLNYKKPFAPLNNRAVWLWTAQYFLNRKDVAQIILVVSPEDYDSVIRKFQADISINEITVVKGGQERSDSIENAISHISPECDFVCVHDAARPCLLPEWIDRVFQTASKTGAAILATPLTDTIKRVETFNTKTTRKADKSSLLDNLIPDVFEENFSGDGKVVQSLNRDGIWRVQTPQVFRRDWFEQVYASRSHSDSARTTDDSMLFEEAGFSVNVIESSSLNIKITTQTDLKLAEAILKILPPSRKSGFSF